MGASRLGPWVLALAGAATAAPEAQMPPAWLVEQEAAYSRSYASGDFAASASALMSRGCIVPPAADRIVDKYHAEGFLRAANASGLGIDLAAHAAAMVAPGMVGAPHAYHSVGVNTATGGVYYARYESNDRRHWGLDTLVLGEGQRLPSTAGHSAAHAYFRGSDVPPQWLLRRMDTLSDLAYSADADAASLLYTKNAVGVDLAAVRGRFVGGGDGGAPLAIMAGSDLKAYVPSFLRGIAAGRLRLIAAHAPDAWLLHMVAEVATPLRTAAGDALVPRRFYMRWARTPGTADDFRIEAHIAGVSDGAAADYIPTPAPEPPQPTPAGVPTPAPVRPTAAPADPPAGDVTPPTWLASLEAAYTASFAAGDFTKVVGMHGPYGAVIPRGAHEIFSKTTLGTFLARIQRERPGLRLGAVLAYPTAPPLMGAPYAYHVLGRNTLNGGLYYMRWEGAVLHIPDAWYVDSMVLGVGDARGSAHAHGRGAGDEGPDVAGDEVPAWMAARVSEITRYADAGAAANLTALYNKNGVVVPASAETVVGPDTLRAFWAAHIGELAGGRTLTVTSVHRVDAWLFHMIAEVRAADTPPTRCYMRWARQVGTVDDFRIEAHIMAIGNPLSWNVESD